MLLKEPVKAVHYYTDTLRLSTDRSTTFTARYLPSCSEAANASNFQTNVPIHEEIKMKCYMIELKDEDFRDSSFVTHL